MFSVYGTPYFIKNTCESPIINTFKINFKYIYFHNCDLYNSLVLVFYGLSDILFIYLQLSLRWQNLISQILVKIT